MDNDAVIIIGAGAAGLSAGLALAAAGRQVTILEGRDRIGGRIQTATTKVGNLPVELGAEFIHGKDNEAWKIVRSAGLVTHEVPDRHWEKNGEHLRETPFREELKKVMQELGRCTFDETFESFLEGGTSLDESRRQLAREYVEGYHGADAKRIGVRAVQRAEAAALEGGGADQFRVSVGYQALIDWMREKLAGHQVTVHCRTVVKRVSWEPGRADVLAESPEGLRTLSGPAVLVTLPLGVLQRQCAASVTFDPPLTEKQEAVQGLAVGRAVKVTLHFSSRFWPVENFGFVHRAGGVFPTWWGDERGNILTAWAGGAQAERLSADTGSPGVLKTALNEAAHLFGAVPDKVSDLLLGGYTHDWAEDPFSCGAYSYTPAGMIEMPELLGAPVAGTLFFAGEATDWNGHQGTVHGALSSGIRAAHEILDSV